MKTLVDCLNLKKGVVSVIGSGGKTSLLQLLARQLPAEKILLSTTTKMGYPLKNSYDQFYQRDFSQLGQAPGVTIAGVVSEHDGRKKITQPLDAAFRDHFPCFDYVFLEADGSKQLPLKGWADFEPVILPETTTTIGIIPLSVLGHMIGPTTVHRLPLFSNLTGATTGDVITPVILQTVIEAAAGLFQKAQGHKILLLNQVETTSAWLAAQTLAQQVDKSVVDQIVAGSTRQNKGVILWQRSMN